MNSSACENVKLADRLRNEDAEQFYTLVRMHLSFVLDLNTEECEPSSDKKSRPPKWTLLPFSRKTKDHRHAKVPDGIALTSNTVTQLQQLITFLCLEENISQEGIFRRSGKLTRQQMLKSLICQGAVLDLPNSEFSVHDCASVLKSILSELPESILTESHYPAYCQIAEFFDVKNENLQERLLRSLQLLLLLLPNENRKLFREIVGLLNLAASHESKNLMSPDNLATLFTPHLLCPRKLSPEALHANSQVMSRVVAFMIVQGPKLFDIPATLATDVRAYWNAKEKRKRSPLKHMNESVCDGTAANTVFSFVDRERTAQENVANPTETALAQLYAYIQRLPESSKKRKLIKQFNKENGHGTPLRTVCSGQKKRTRSRSLGDSIKKHLPVFNKAPKRIPNEHNSPMAITQLGSPPVINGMRHENIMHSASKTEYLPGLKQNLLDDTVLVKHQARRREKPETARQLKMDDFNEEALSCLRQSLKKPLRSQSCEILDACEVPAEPVQKVLVMKRRSNSPLPTPSPPNTPCLPHGNFLAAQDWSVSTPRTPKNQANSMLSYGGKTNACFSNGVETEDTNTLVKHKMSVVEHSPMLPQHGLRFGSTSHMYLSNIDCFLSAHNSTNRAIAATPVRGARAQMLLTSTPASCFMTPIVDKNNSMSPITRSTQRMPKAMQETMMTPRSRKPVISLSGTDLCNLASINSWDMPLEEDPEHGANVIPKASDFVKTIAEDNLEESETRQDSLSSTFRDYLLSRSVLTASPVDLSFSSRTDDFLSMSEKSSTFSEEYKSIPESILNDAGLSDSLMYCLDGNEPTSPNSCTTHVQEGSYSSAGTSQVHETAL